MKRKFKIGDVVVVKYRSTRLFADDKYIDTQYTGLIGEVIGIIESFGIEHIVIYIFSPIFNCIQSYSFYNSEIEYIGKL
jgi:hypothetical protein